MKSTLMRKSLKLAITGLIMDSAGGVRSAPDVWVSASMSGRENKIPDFCSSA